jgi:hypothetical protein
MEQRVRKFTETGATVVMLTQPPYWQSGNPTGPTPQDKDFERLNALIVNLARHTPHVEVINLAAYVCPSGPPCPILVDGLWVRGDGAHYTGVGSLWVARWLMPQLGIKVLAKPTTSLPVTKVAAPSNGTVIKGFHIVDATAPFDFGVSKVEFRVTGGTLRNVVIGTGTLGKYGWAFLWNSTGVPNGTYTMRSVAYGASGERSTSPAITVKVAN